MEAGRGYVLRLMTPFARRLTLWSLVALGIGGSVFGISKFVTIRSEEAVSLSTSGETLMTSAVRSGDWSKGSPLASVVLVEYSDLQCPACRYYYPMVKELSREFGDRLRVVYRHFPLRIHQFAEFAAQASEAAGTQDKFWEMHDLLFERQSDWSSEAPRDTFMEYARELGLDVNRFERDLASAATRQAIIEDSRDGEAAGVNATPTFFLNGQKIKNSRSYGEFRDIIAQAIE